MVINKVELANRVAKDTGVTKKDTTAIIESVFNVLATALIDGEEVAIPHFGKFKTVIRSERLGVNPKDTSERITIPAKRVVKFTPSSGLKRDVSNA